MSEETAWLVEEVWTGFVHYIHRDFDARLWIDDCASVAEFPYRWVFSDSGGATLTRRCGSVPFLTKDIDEAMRFPTREAAEAWMAGQHILGGGQYQPREHMWCGGDGMGRDPSPTGQLRDQEQNPTSVEGG